MLSGKEASRSSLCAFPLPCSFSLASSRKVLIPLSDALTFVAAARGHLYITWFWCPAGFMLIGPTGLCIFAYFKSSCPRLCFLIGLILGAEISPFGTLTGLGTPSQLGVMKNKIGCLDNHKDSMTTKSRARLNDKVYL